MKLPKVAVIVGTYNMARYLPEALDSILGQRYPNVETVVVDDGSTDGTEALIRAKYSERLTYIRQENRGLFAARNVGIRAVKDADYYSMVDADDRVHPLKIWDEVAFLERFPDAVFCFSNLMSFAEQPRYTCVLWNARDVIGTDEPWGMIHKPLAKLARQDAYTSVTTMRAPALRAIGLYDESLKCSGDLDLAIRLSRLGCGGFINKVRYLYRVEGQGMTSYVRDRVAVHMRIFEKVRAHSGEYSAEELNLLKEKEQACLLLALKGIAAGRVEPRLANLVEKRFRDGATPRQVAILWLVKCVKRLGLGKAVSEWKARGRLRAWNAEATVGLDDVMSDMSPCFETVLPEW